MTELASPGNPLIKKWRQLLAPKGRREHGLFLAEGEHLAGEAVKAGAARALLVQRGQQGRYTHLIRTETPLYLVSPQVLSALSESRTPQGVSTVCALPAAQPLSEAGDRLVALNRVQDPGNVGAILRTMDAAAFHGLLIDPGCADPFSPKALRASMGAVFRVPVYPCDDLAEAFKMLPGHVRVAGDLHGSPYEKHSPFGGKVCILVGNEGAGLEERLSALADYRLRLPMPGGAESLNAAVSASLFIYDFLLKSR